MKRRWHALSLDLALDSSGKPPTRFRIFKKGINTSTQGPFLFDDVAAASVMEKFSRHGVALTADYEHQTLNAKENGRPAPASAYFWKPEIIDGELWATDVKWTDAAALSIEKREYNYFSPLFRNTKAGRVTEVVNLALVNVPSLDDLEPLMAASGLSRAGDDDNDDDDQGANAMKKCSACKEEIGGDDSVMHSACATSKASALTALSVTLGLTAGADVAVMTGEAQGLVALRTELRRLTGKELGPDLLGVISAWKTNSEEVTALKAKLAADTQKTIDAELEAVLDQAQKDLKLTDGERPSLKAMSVALTGGKATNESITALKANIAARTPFATSEGGAIRQPAGPDHITPDDAAAAAMLGHSTKFVSEQRKAQREAGLPVG